MRNIHRSSFQRFFSRIRSSAIQNYLVMAMLSINFIVVVILMFQSYISCNLNGLDVGVYNQIMYNMTQGKFLQNYTLELVRSMNEETNHFAIHNQLVLYLFYPLYALSPSVFTLGVIQALILTLAAYVLYRLSLVKLKHPLLALLVLAVFLLYPYSWGPILVTFFHTEAFALVAFIAAIYFLETGHLRLCFLFVTLGMMCKENMSALAVTFGFYLFLVKKQRAGLALSLWGLVWFLVNVLVVVPLARGLNTGEAWYVDRYTYLGRNYGEILAAALRYPGLVLRVLVAPEKLAYLNQLFSPLLFLSLLSPTTLLIALPSLLQNLLSSYSGDFIPIERDVFPVVAFLFVAFVYGLSNLMTLIEWLAARLSQRLESVGLYRLLLPALRPVPLTAVLLVGIALLNLRQYPFLGASTTIEGVKEFDDTCIAARLEIPYLKNFTAAQSCREVVNYFNEQVLPSASISVPKPLLGFSSISGRGKAYIYPKFQDQTDYVVIPRNEIARNDSPVQANLGYELAYENAEYVVLRKAGLQDAGPADVGPAREGPTALSSGDFLDISKAAIKGVLFVTRETWTIAGKTRPVLFVYPQIYNIGRVTYKVALPAQAKLQFGIGIHPEVWDKPGDGVLYEIDINREVIFSKYIDPKSNPEDRQWLDFEIDLAKYAGQEVEISLRTSPGNARGSNILYDWSGWAEPRLIGSGQSRAAYDLIDHLSQASSTGASIDAGLYRLGQNERRALFEHPAEEGQPATLMYPEVAIPENAFLRFGIGMQQEVWDQPGDGVRFEVLINDQQIFSQTIDPKNLPQDRKWHDFSLDLSAYAGQTVKVALLVWPNQNYVFDWAAWADPAIVVDH